jgi:hypothetical protein
MHNQPVPCIAIKRAPATPAESACRCADAASLAHIEALVSGKHRQLRWKCCNKALAPLTAADPVVMQVNTQAGGCASQRGGVDVSGAGECCSKPVGHSCRSCMGNAPCRLDFYQMFR